MVEIMVEMEESKNIRKKGNRKERIHVEIEENVARRKIKKGKWGKRNDKRNVNGTMKK